MRAMRQFSRALPSWMCTPSSMSWPGNRLRSTRSLLTGNFCLARIQFYFFFCDSQAVLLNPREQIVVVVDLLRKDKMSCVYYLMILPLGFHLIRQMRRSSWNLYHTAHIYIISVEQVPQICCYCFTHSFALWELLPAIQERADVRECVGEIGSGPMYIWDTGNNQ